MADRKPMAFMSYAHIDDRLNRGYLTEFCECLSGEVCLHLGEEFPIFMDRKDIKWGDSWKKRIEESIDGTTFLIPIISPGFFKSQNCRNELNLFLERERELERDDLILPIYLIDTPLLNDKIKKNQDKLAQTIASRQYADWRGLRFEDLGTGAVRRELSKLAAHIRNALDSMPPSSRDHEPAVETPAPVHHETRPYIDASENKVEERPKPEMPTVVVDQWHRGDYTTISQAIKEADPGSRILVHSGIYDEGLILDKPLCIVGDGNLGDVVIRAEGKDAILFKAARGRVENLVLQQIGGGNFYGVDIQQGLLEIEGCDITSNSLSCVAIHGKAFPKLRGNKIHDGESAGIFVYENGQGLIEDNEIFGNANAGISIKEAGNPTVRRNRIHDGKASGIFIYENGQGLIEDNDIFGNTLTGIEIKKAGNPTVRGNRINKNAYNAVYIHDKGAGIIEKNDLRDNKQGAWDISRDSKNLVKRFGNQE
ncbi:MAG: right-handed parallel beta-helix repeat-containing protein [Methanothrix sp.]|nr:right-handed parallel beta-helix repeat-containing protein [Methanothrix sp.]